MENENPKVSVVVPIYNGEEYIDDVIPMLLRQTLKDIEIIAVDDGSEDRSLVLLNAIAAKDERVRVFKKENGGVASARNLGLMAARGEYICFCDMDDIVPEDAYEKMYALAVSLSADEKEEASDPENGIDEGTKDSGYDVVLASTGKIVGGEKEEFERLPDGVLEREDINTRCILPIIFNELDVSFSDDDVRLERDIWKCMVKRSLVVEKRLQIRKIVSYEGDYLFLLDVLARAKSAAMMHDTMYYWRINTRSETFTAKFVEGLYEKDIELRDEIIKILNISGIDKEHIDGYILTNNCDRYMHMIENEGRRDDLPFGERIKNIKRVKEEESFAESLKLRKLYKKNYLQKKIVLLFLSKKMFAAAYLFHKVYFGIKKKFVNFRFWTRIENKLYGK